MEPDDLLVTTLFSLVDGQRTVEECREALTASAGNLDGALTLIFNSNAPAAATSSSSSAWVPVGPIELDEPAPSFAPAAPSARPSFAPSVPSVAPSFVPAAPSFAPAAVAPAPPASLDAELALSPTAKMAARRAKAKAKMEARAAENKAARVAAAKAAAAEAKAKTKPSRTQFGSSEDESVPLTPPQPERRPGLLSRLSGRMSVGGEEPMLGLIRERSRSRSREGGLSSGVRFRESGKFLTVHKTPETHAFCGEYVRDGDLSGKPLYRYLGASSTCIYFGDLQAGLGWWIGPDPAKSVPCCQAYAFNPETCDALPLAGWREAHAGRKLLNISITLDSQSSDYEVVPLGQWAYFRVLLPKDYRIWAKNVRNHPPPLTLKREQQQGLPSESTGRLHERDDEKKKTKEEVRPMGSSTAAPKAVLKQHFMSLLQDVRFAPSQITLTWRSSDKYEVPEGLEGALPPRPFTLLDNAKDAPAPQPPRFKNHQLRPEQLQSLAWMLAQERGEGAGDFHVTWRQFRNRAKELPFTGRSERERLLPGTIVKANWRGAIYEASVRSAKISTVWLDWLDNDGTSTWSEPTWSMDKITSIVQHSMLEVKASATYDVRGGILCDKIGYGKTATTIGLIDSTLGSPIPNIPEPDKGNFMRANGTLIIVPSNLWDQWLNEISKFVYNEKPLRNHLSKGWSPDACPMKIFALRDVRHLTKVTPQKLAEADVVLCSYRLLYSAIYTTQLHKWQQHTGQKVTGAENVPAKRKLPHNWENGEEPQNKQKDDEKDFPVLEAFYWKRVVFDEFHELESFESPQQGCLQRLRAHFRWGLTGTPPVNSNAGVIFMSSLFRIDLPGSLDNRSLTPWEGDRLLTEQCAHFLQRYARQNKADLPSIGLQEHVLVVKHTPEERALYLGQAHDAPDPTSPDAYDTPEKVSSLERLLVLCSHFQAGGVDGGVMDAKDECRRISESKKLRVVKAKNALSRACNILRVLGDKCGGTPEDSPLQSERFKKAAADLRASCSEGAPPAVAAGVLEEALTHALIASKELVLDELDMHKVKFDLLTAHFHDVPKGQGLRPQWVAFMLKEVEPAALRAMVDQVTGGVLEGLAEIRAATASLDFFERTLAALAGGATTEQRSCCVCLEDDIALDKLAITPCAHMFCIDCLKLTVNSFKQCSVCRQALTLKDIQPVSMELPRAPAESSGADGSGGSSEGSEEAAKKRLYGSKIAALVEKLHELRREDPTSKVILFVQFDDLKRKVATALHHFGIPTAQLKGAVSQRANIIEDWQQNSESSTFVLLLSLANSASGTNLTAASHVIFLHPMLCPTAEQAAGYELQAIGRARRYGQKRDAVHVWRFVTAETVESALWERARQAGGGQAGAGPASSA